MTRQTQPTNLTASDLASFFTTSKIDAIHLALLIVIQLLIRNGLMQSSVNLRLVLPLTYAALSISSHENRTILILFLLSS